MTIPATRNGRFQVDGSDCFQVAITVPLITRPSAVPSTPMIAAALRVRLLPKTSGTTAMFVRPPTTLARRTAPINATMGQYPPTSVYEYVHAPMTNKPDAMYGARRPTALRVRSLALPKTGYASQPISWLELRANETARAFAPVR